MKCPKCGKIVKNDAKFCFACGAKLEQPKAAEAEKIEVQHVKMKSEARKVKKKGKGKKVGKIIVAVGVCVAVVVAGVNIALRLTQTDNPCVYVSDGTLNLLTKMRKEGSIEFADGVINPSVLEYTVQFSPNGKYLYFNTKCEDYGEQSSLCRIKWDKLNKNLEKSQCYAKVETISSDAALGYAFLSDEEILYRDINDVLYYYDGKESTKISKQVEYYYAEQDGRLIYTKKNGEDGNCTLYGSTKDDLDNRTKLASNIKRVNDVYDINNIFIAIDPPAEEYSPENREIGIVGFDKELQIIAKESEVLTYDKGIAYYTQKQDETLNPYDYIEGAEKLDNLEEPTTEDYQITRDKYEMIGEGTVVEDYEELYTSCTQESMFMPDGENMEDQPEAEFQDFVKKYKNLENEDGYIQVTDEIKDELKNLAALYGEGYENEWLELCFGKKTETVTDEEAYNAARDEYEKLLDIKETCESFKEDNAVSLKTLYCYRDGKVSTVSKDIVALHQGINSIVYNTKDMIQEKIKLENINESDDVKSLFQFRYGGQNHIIRTLDGKEIQLSEDGLEYWKEQTENTLGMIGFLGDYAIIDDDNMGIAPIDGNKIGKFTPMGENAQRIYSNEKDRVYFAEAKDNDYEYFDLYCIKDGKSTLLAEDITLSDVSCYEDGTVLASTSGKNEDGYELSISNKNGSMKYLGDDVSAYLRLDEKNLLYISDGDLYLYNGEEKEVLAYDVDGMWSMKSMEIKGFSYHNY